MDAELATALSHSRVLVTDFDGTLAPRDFFERALERLPPGLPDYFGQYEQGLITHFEALRQIYAHIPGDEQAGMAIARETGLEASLPQSLLRLEQAGWRVVIVSAGCHWYIDRLLTERQVRVPVASNPGDFIAGQGLVMRLPLDSPFYCAQTGIDKEAVVRHALEHAGEVAFAGDGRPDLAPALLVPPERRFARGWLARALEKRGQPFRRFELWSEIVGMLLDKS